MRQFRIALLRYTCPPIVGVVEEIIRQHASLFNRYSRKIKTFPSAAALFTDIYRNLALALILSYLPARLSSEFSL